MVALLAYTVLTRPYDSIASYFLENSVSGGGGTNVVNVIWSTSAASIPG